MKKPYETAPDASLAKDAGNFSDAASEMADVLEKHFPHLIRNDFDRDGLEMSLRDLCYDMAAGRINAFQLGQDDHYDEQGNCC